MPVMSAAAPLPSTWTIRLESPEDTALIEALNADSFGPGRFAKSAYRLREGVDPVAALNFVAEGALGGGVSRSLSLDNYGKALSAAILGFEIEVPPQYGNLLRGG